MIWRDSHGCLDQILKCGLEISRKMARNPANTQNCFTYVYPNAKRVHNMPRFLSSVEENLVHTRCPSHHQSPNCVFVGPCRPSPQLWVFCCHRHYKCPRDACDTSDARAIRAKCHIRSKLFGPLLVHRPLHMDSPAPPPPRRFLKPARTPLQGEVGRAIAHGRVNRD